MLYYSIPRMLIWKMLHFYFCEVPFKWNVISRLKSVGYRVPCFLMGIIEKRWLKIVFYNDSVFTSGYYHFIHSTLHSTPFLLYLFILLPNKFVLVWNSENIDLLKLFNALVYGYNVI